MKFLDILDNLKEVCDNEKMVARKSILFCCFTFLRFQFGRWSTFSCVSCFVLESKEMRKVNICGEAHV